MNTIPKMNKWAEELLERAEGDVTPAELLLVLQTAALLKIVVVLDAMDDKLLSIG